MAQEETKVPGIDKANQANIQAIISASQARIKAMNEKRASIGSSVGAVTGAAIVGALSLGIGIPAGMAIGSAVGGFLGKITAIFNKKQPWSGLSNEDKNNLVDGLILEAVWIKGLLDVQAVKNSVVNTLQSSKPQIVESNNTTFWGANAWGVNHIVAEIDKAKKLIDQVKRIQQSFDTEIAMYTQKQNVALAYQAYEKMKAGQTISQTEANAFVSGVATIKAGIIARGLKTGMNQPKKEIVKP